MTAEIKMRNASTGDQPAATELGKKVIPDAAEMRWRLATIGIPTVVLRRWFPNDGAGQSPVNALQKMLSDGFHPMAYSMAVDLANSWDREFVDWASSHADRLPAAFLFETARRVIDKDVATGLNWFYAAALRGDFEISVCTEEGADQGYAMIRAYTENGFRDRGVVTMYDQFSASVE